MVDIKHKFKHIIPLFLVMLAVFSVLTAFDKTGQKVFDNAHLLSDSEITKLTKECVSAAQATETDIIILTINKDGGKSSMNYAEDFFMDHDFGYDTVHGDAVLLLINMDEREMWISTSGKAINYLSDARIDNIISNMRTYASSGSYAKACQVFVDKVESYITRGGTSVDSDGTDGDFYTVNDYDSLSLRERIFLHFPIKILIALAVAAIAILVMMYKAKSHMTVNGNTYIKDNNFNILNRNDTYIRTTVTKHRIQQNNGGHGGSFGGGSSHSGSGGHSFGGGGGHF